MSLHPLRREAPARPPTRVLVLAHRGLAGIDTVLEGLVLARGRYIADAHLTVLAQDLDDADAIRLETKIRELALTHSVELAPFEDPAQVRAAVGEAHALIDTTPRDGDLQLAVVGAMAAGVPVLSSCAHVQRLTDGVSIPLGFSEGSADELAQRIGALDNAWSDELATVGRAAPRARRRRALGGALGHDRHVDRAVRPRPPAARRPRGTRGARRPCSAVTAAPPAPSATQAPRAAPAPAAPEAPRDAGIPGPVTWTAGSEAPSTNGVETHPDAAADAAATDAPGTDGTDGTGVDDDGDEADEAVTAPAGGRRGWRRKRKG